MNRTFWTSILTAALIASIGCGQAVSTKQTEDKEPQPLAARKILGIYPTSTVMGIKFENVGGYPPPAPYTHYSIGISLGHPTILTKTGRDDLFSWNCDFVLTPSERDQLIANLESAYLVREDRDSIMVDAGNSYLKVISTSQRLLGEHPFKGGDNLDPAILLIEGQPLIQQLNELLHRYECLQVN